MGWLNRYQFARHLLASDCVLPAFVLQHRPLIKNGTLQRGSVSVCGRKKSRYAKWHRLKGFAVGFFHA